MILVRQSEIILFSNCMLRSSQVYAGLLRNLSWMADAEMSATLSPTVSALTRASLRAYRANESKCLCATLSALWNLASHSRENKKSICEQSGFLDMIVELLTTDAQHTVCTFLHNLGTAFSKYFIVRWSDALE